MVSSQIQEHYKIKEVTEQELSEALHSSDASLFESPFIVRGLPWLRELFEGSEVLRSQSTGLKTASEKAKIQGRQRGGAKLQGDSLGLCSCKSLKVDGVAEAFEYEKDVCWEPGAKLFHRQRRFSGRGLQDV